MLHINDRAYLREKLLLLRAGTKPVFGRMSAHQMIEHLCFAVDFSNGIAPQQTVYEPALLAKIKYIFIQSEKPLPIGFKTPVLPEDPIPVHTRDIPEAVITLFQSLDLFDTYFSEHPDATPVHPTMGVLNHAEWVIFHNKHFTHHFTQFSLLP